MHQAKGSIHDMTMNADAGFDDDTGKKEKETELQQFNSCLLLHSFSFSMVLHFSLLFKVKNEIVSSLSSMPPLKTNRTSSKPLHRRQRVKDF